MCNIDLNGLHFFSCFTDLIVLGQTCTCDSFIFCLLISEYLLNHGVDCFHDNIKLVTMSHIVFLCVLPSQIPAICDEIKSCVAPTLFVYSFASSCPVKKLRQLLGTANVVRPDYIMSEEQDIIPWDYSLNVQKALENKEIVSLTYPLSREKGMLSHF